MHEEGSSVKPEQGDLDCSIIRTREDSIDVQCLYRFSHRALTVTAYSDQAYPKKRYKMLRRARVLRNRSIYVQTQTIMRGFQVHGPGDIRTYGCEDDGIVVDEKPS